MSEICTKAFRRTLGFFVLTIRKLLLGERLSVQLGSACSLSCRFKLANGSRLILLSRSYLAHHVEIIAEKNSRIIIGAGTTIGSYSRIVSHAQIVIGRRCAIAPSATIIDHNHVRDRSTGRLSGYELKPICIGDDVWIGEKAVILMGVSIGNRSTIGAGAVVTRSIPDDVVVAGVPARIIANTAC